MNRLALTFSDIGTMLRRDLLHSVRYKAMTISGLALPIVMMLLFNYVFGVAIAAEGVHGLSYVNYLVPGILIMTVAAGCQTTAVNLNQDMTEGIITRFRTMAIVRTSVLTGTVLGSLIRTLASVILVTAVALLLGYRPLGGPLDWLGAFGVIALVTFGVTWMGVLFGLIGQNVGAANSMAILFQIFVFTSSAFVNPDLMAPGIRWFAKFQPFTPVIDTLRGLLLGTHIDAYVVPLAIAWCLVLALVGYLWARAIYNRGPVR